MVQNGRVENREGRRGPSGQNLLKIVILGEGGVGKSSLLNRFVKDVFDERCAHTVGVEFLKKELEIDGTTYTLQIWDTAGQERFRSLRTPFYRGADICLLVFAVDDKKGFERLPFWLSEFSHHTDLKNPSQFPFVVVGNKADKLSGNSGSDAEIESYTQSNSGLTVAREVTAREAEEWSCRQGPFPYIETSAKDSVNIHQLFYAAIQSWTNLNNETIRSAAENLADQADVPITLHSSRHENSAHSRKKKRCC